MKKTSSILVVGSLNMDAVVKVRTIPKPGETILGSNIEKIPGGKGANQACAAGKLGGKVRMLGAVGADDNGEILLKSLQNAHVETEAVRKIPGANTGIANIYVEDSGDNCIVVSSGANGQCDISYLQSQDQQIKNCTILLVQLEIPLEAVAYVVKRAKELGKKVILNPAPAPGVLAGTLLNQVDILTPNETELAILTESEPTEDLEEIKAMGQKLLKKGVKHLIVTLGKNGCLFLEQEQCHHFPAYQVNAVDTTAAGDTFSGGIAVMLAEGKSMEEAIAFAMKASSLTVQRKGAQSSIPSREEVR